MEINTGDGFELATGRLVRVASIYDLYTRYDTGEQVGHEPETYVRYSHWWHDGRVIAPKTDPLDDFLAKAEEKVPANELPDAKPPDE